MLTVTIISAAAETPAVAVPPLLLQTWAIGPGAAPTTPVAGTASAAGAAAVAAAAAGGASSGAGDDNLTPKGEPDRPLPASVQGNPVQGVQVKEPMASMVEVTRLIRAGLEGFRVIDSRRRGPGVPP
jgi:hypothetical protein